MEEQTQDNVSENENILTFDNGAVIEPEQAPAKPDGPELVVQTRDLVKRYGSFLAVNYVNLQIERGAIYGFIGPNGAGKTTTMRILSTLLDQSSGEGWVCGYPVSNKSRSNLKAIRRSIGYMPDYFGIYDRMKSWEYLDFFASAFYVDTKKREALVRDLLALVDLGEKRNTYIEDLSRGMKQRLGLARTLVHDPELLILDEPASGLDPRARVELRELLRELTRMGKTILVSSHILTELAEMCTHIGIIERGTLLAQGRVSDIIRAMRHNVRQVRIQVMLDGSKTLEEIGAIIQANPLVQKVEITQQHSSESSQFVTFEVSMELSVEGTEAELNKLLKNLILQEVNIYGFVEREDNLEDIFMKVTKGLVA